MNWKDAVGIVFLFFLIAGMGKWMVCLDEKAAEERHPRDEANAAMWRKAEQAGIDNCLRRGRVPVRSSWDGRLVDCR